MTLIVEDGQGRPDADSYVSVADCVQYAAEYGLAFAGETSKQEAALRMATRYIDGYSFRGSRSTVDQALAWPRTFVDNPSSSWYLQSPWGAVPVDPAGQVIPREVVQAACELACRGILRPLVSDVPARVISEQKIGPITQKFEDTGSSGQIRYAAVDALLQRWLRGAQVSVPLVRA